jgi:murein DD-endopeptidase MepM/ murein hydrolase activator NlpD
VDWSSALELVERLRSHWLAATIFGASCVLSYVLIQGEGGDPGAVPDVRSGPVPEAVDPAVAGPEPVGVERLAAELVAAEPEGPPAPIELADWRPEVAKAPSTGLHVITGRIARGSSLAAALRGEGVDPAVVHDLAAALRPLFDFRRAQADDHFTLIRDDQGEVLSFEFQRGRRTVYRLERRSDGTLQAHADSLPLERRVVHLGGVVNESLFDALRALGEQGELVNSFTDIFAWEFDFSSQTQPGDEFRMVFEKFYDHNGFVSYGHVLAALYRSGDREFTAVYFNDDDGYADYYSPNGESVRQTFLRAPLAYTRISSRYTKSRLHPILKVRRPHEGIDYAAPVGTPIWAVADGKVIHMGRSGGFGRLIKIRHANGYTSFYGHLSRYANGITVGKQVKQKQVIGYVGSSGLSTGPHLDYRLKHAGRFVDPLSVKFPLGKPVSVQARDRFEKERDVLMADLRAASPSLVLEAGM